MLLFYWSVGGARRGSTPFCFENMWLRSDGFQELLEGWWKGVFVHGKASFVLSRKLKEIKVLIKGWNRDCFGRLDYNKKLALSNVEAWDHVSVDRNLTLEESEARREAKEAYKKWVLLEEINWRWKSRELWLKEGDRNTGFFHRMANAHLRKNALVKIKINGDWISGEQEIREGVVTAFKSLLNESMGWRANIEGLPFVALTLEEATSLEFPFREEKFFLP